MKIAITSCFMIAFAISAIAAEPLEGLLRLSAACQNAAFKRSAGVEDPSKFSEFIKATDKAMQELVDAGYLIEIHFLMRAPSRMNGNERVQFEQQRMKLVEDLAPQYGHYTVIEMMGWEFRDQIQGGRFFRPTRDESQDYLLRVRLPEPAMKKLKALLSDYILRTIPKTETGEQDGGGNAPEPPAHPSTARPKARATP